MVDLVVKSMIKQFETIFEQYFPIYSYPLAGLDNSLDVYGRTQVLQKFVEGANKSTKSSVLLGYKRGVVKPDTRRRTHAQSAHYAHSVSDVKSFKKGGIYFVNFDLDFTILTQDVLNMEIVENIFVMKFSKGSVLDLVINVEDNQSPIKLRYEVDLNDNLSGINLIDFKSLGSYWELDISFNLKGIMYSIESEYYPKLIDTYVNVYQEGVGDMRFTRHNILDKDGKISSYTVRGERIEISLSPS